MKQHFRRLIALALVLCMVCPMALTAQASGWGSRGSSRGSSGWTSSWWNDWWKGWWNNDEEEESAGDPGMTLALVEDQTTVSEDVEMRASVYAADESDPVAQAELGENNVIYYPTTLIDYDATTSGGGTINQSMANLEVQYAVENDLSTSSNGWSWKGMYFGMYNRNQRRTGTYGSTSVTSSSYADWVKWGLNDNETYGPYIHSGMVSGLVDGVPQFNGSNASRLFDSSEVDGKHVYTDVGLPFVYDQETGYYTFDSSERGAYFPDGVAESGAKLTLMSNPVVVQPYGSENYHTAFMPFNTPSSNTVTNFYNTAGDRVSGTAYTLSGTSNFFYSMITSVPFTMTENGRMVSSDDTSEPIVFEFSGDDDVWVFVDDVLILDLGGVHGPVSGEINFATNQVQFWTTDDSGLVGDATDGGYGTASAGQKISQGAIFNDGETVGKLNTTRSTFAASDNHTLTVVYVERGANLSNNKISFNLPQKDYIAVSKQIDENLYKNTDETTVADQLTDELFATLNQRDFTYVLYENGTAMTGVRFSRYDVNGNFVGNGSTASDGTFTVKNGETVRFYDIEFDGTKSYYVAELDPDANSNNNAWGTAAWAHTINTAYGDSATVEDTTKPANYYVSDTITTKGSTEAVDVIYFTNTNKLLSPVADIANDEYVLDFGLAVELNPLANDTYSATTDTLTLAGVSNAVDGTFGTSAIGEFGTLEIVNGKAVYTLSAQLTGVETFYYQVGLTSGADDLEGTVGTITIMPATTMYYEESFAGLGLTGTWEDKGTAQGGNQEEGRVGNTTDSPYGSDDVYKNNTGDSYGTSKYVNTTDAAATFRYTFTGTGTALYARTSDKSAYMMITVTDAAGNTVHTWNRNTIYKPVEDTALTDNTLYNIPVFAYDAGTYGTYTVTVALTKAITVNGSYYRGCDFYLDGIRVYNPANAYPAGTASEEVTMIEDAYARDGEAYITVDTLREKLLSDWDPETYVVFTDSNGEIRDAETYESAGPKEEVYMKAGQSVTFSLDNWDQNQNKVFLGIKAPSGSGSVSINGNDIAINNTTDIYYDITDYAEVSNNVATFVVTAESALISVTTIKVTGTADFTIVDVAE